MSIEPRDKRHWRTMQGLCYGCSGQPTPGYKSCEACRKKYASKYVPKVSHCQYDGCGLRLPHAHQLWCARHGAKMRRKQALAAYERSKQRARGLVVCYSCGGEPDPSYKTCTRCRNKMAAAKRKSLKRKARDAA